MALLIFIFLATFAALVLAFFALSSCLGEEIRAAWAGHGRRNTVPTTYGLQYARVMGGGGGGSGGSLQTGWEQIEMEDMLDQRLGRDDVDDDDEE